MADPRVAERFSRLVDLMARLRGPQGCPWDREQTPESLRPYLLEEVYEVLEAIEGGQASALCDELGDLLLQIVFQSQLAAEAGRFTIADVSRSITDKLVRRHPHVFADVQVRDAQEVIHNWGRIKDEERKAKGEVGILAGVPRTLPALVRAQQVDEKVARASGQRTEGRDVIGHLLRGRTGAGALYPRAAGRRRGIDGARAGSAALQHRAPRPSPRPLGRDHPPLRHGALHRSRRAPRRRRPQAGGDPRRARSSRARAVAARARCQSRRLMRFDASRSRMVAGKPGGPRTWRITPRR